MRITSPFGKDSYRPGGTYGICDICGGKYRLKELRRQWNGLLACRDDWSPQHPQEHLRGVQERIKYPGEVRPEQEDTFVSTPVTQDDL